MNVNGELKCEISINESYQWDGWNDTGVREFRTNILKNLAREIIQNSLDADINQSETLLR